MREPRTFRHYVGVDLGGGKGKKTAVATLRAEAGAAFVTAISPRSGALPLYDAALVEAIHAHGPETLLCVDAPLTLPPCLRCEVPLCPGQDACVDPEVVIMRSIAARAIDRPAPAGRTSERDGRRGKPAITPYTQRATEVYLAYGRGIVPREALGQGTGPLAARAAHLVRRLSDRFQLNVNLLEVFPKGTLHALGFDRPYKKHLHERETRAIILDALGPDLRFAPGVWRESCVQSDHFFDAVISAYTGYLWARDGWTLPQPEAAVHARNGWIWIPPAPAELEEAAAASAKAAEA